MFTTFIDHYSSINCSLCDVTLFCIFQEWDVPEGMYKGAKVVVAGADTYLGFKIVERLVAKGLPVRALVRPNVTNQVRDMCSTRDA